MMKMMGRWVGLSGLFCFAFSVLFFSSAAFADELGDNSAKLQVKIGGEIDAQMAKNTSYGPYDQAFLPDGRVNPATNGVSGRVRAMANVEVALKTRNFRYGGFFGLQTGKIEDDFSPYAKEAYIFVENPYGKIEFGAAYSAAARMRIDATNIARATGGIQGDWFRYVPMPTYHSSDESLVMGAAPVFILQPMLPNEAGFTTGAFNGNYVYSNASYAPAGSTPGTTLYQNVVQPRLGWGSISNKISYYTKRMAGFQAGLSYSPNTGLTGVMANQHSGYAKDYMGQYYQLNSLGVAGNVENLVALGINYVKKFGEVTVGASFTYEHGAYQGKVFSYDGTKYSGIPGREDLNAFAVGAQLGYGPISVAYSYGNWLNSLMNNSLVYYHSNGAMIGKRADFHTAGLGLTFGPINVSTTYMYSNYRGNIMNLCSVGTDIKLGGLWGRGFVPYFEVTYYDLSPAFGKSSSGQLLKADDVRGVIVLGGVKLIF